MVKGEQMIQPKTIAYLRTTGETVFVISTNTTDEGTFATVRRPVHTENGILHDEEEYYVEELETQEAHIIRAKKEAEEYFAQLTDSNTAERVLGAGN